ncbi:MAG: phospholipase D-like domain-containing protein [Candidatus Thermoplasmatota archaeon]|nr:phospholipase D-like domain-containing protein [Candidatus Thermoplasmatota archaeon]
MSKKGERYALFFLFILIIIYIFPKNCIASDIDNILINEIMYGPLLDDSKYEWIELYNPTNTSYDLTNWSVRDNSQTDTLHPFNTTITDSMVLNPYSYAIITDKDTLLYTNLSNNIDALRITVDDLSIGNGLGNSGDYIQLIDDGGSIIDSVEWGIDYPLIPGTPANLVAEGHSLCRHHEKDTDNSSLDFYEGIVPTPGTENIYLEKGQLSIITYPLFLPKAYEHEQYGLPFAIQITLQNFTPFSPYELKSYITSETQTTYPASQTWDGSRWQYSDRYLINISTDENGQWTDWVYLRLYTGYLAYQHDILQNSTALIQVKLRKNSVIEHAIQKVALLDMDNSTNNATTGGYLVSVSMFPDHIALLSNQTGSITGIYKTEDNGIDEDMCINPGYYRITSPTGANYSLSFYDEAMNHIKTIENISIRQGRYQLDLFTAEKNVNLYPKEERTLPLIIQNKGDFPDNITLELTTVGNHWKIRLDTTSIYLDAKHNITIPLIIKPPNNPRQQTQTEQITITVLSESDHNIQDTITIYCELIGPDLSINKIICYDEQGNETGTLHEGESTRIKAYLKNQGSENASNVYVSFYLDQIDPEHLIGVKYYDLVSKYQKYPSIIWDTHGVSPGEHILYVIVDEQNTINEIDESNNMLETTLYLFDTSPLQEATSLVISEFYYYTRPGIANEYICLFNPTNSTIDISGWYLTTKPWKPRADQQKLYFPSNTTISPFQTLTITQNATAYQWETGKMPDYEYKDDSLESIPQLYATSTITFSNTGGAVALKDYYNHTIDILAYGDIDQPLEGWNGPPIPGVKRGEILVQTSHKTIEEDADTLEEWKNLRRYCIGQSRFPLRTISDTVTITTFVSPDNSYRVISQYIQNATSSISFNIYEFTNPFLCDILIDALKRNVHVRVFIEGSPVGGISQDERILLNRLHTYGAEIRFIVQNQSADIYARYPFNHAKYLIIDTHSVIIESCNWVYTGVPIDPSYGNREWGIVINNPSVASYVLSVFEDDWDPTRADSVSFEDLQLQIADPTFVPKKVYYGRYKPQFEPFTYTGYCNITPVFSPDTSLEALLYMIESAKKTIYIEQLYIYMDWEEQMSPLVQRLAEKAQQGIDIRILMNYNPAYGTSNDKCNQTKTYLEQQGVQVRYLYTNWSIFRNLHNKGMIVDNTTVLISSINWNENSIMNNREAGIIIECEEIATYYAEVFFFDWTLDETSFDRIYEDAESDEPNNTIYIVSLFTMTFAVIARDWRKRKWT